MEGADLSQDAIDAIDNCYDKDEAILVCPFTAWEVGMLVSRGKLPSITGPLEWYKALIGLPLIEEVELLPEVMINSSFLIGDPPRDPMDRIIIATANQTGATIITRDKLILEYAKAGNCLALGC